MLNELANTCHSIARDKGFWEHEYLPDDGGTTQPNPSIFPEKVMLMVTECAEMIDAQRDGSVPHEEEELADLLIRALDYGAARGFDIDAAVVKKMDKNRQRGHLHGREF